jgi:Ca2+-transporting ATPase
MERPPRRKGEAVITPQMWAGILWVGAIMAASTLAVLSASLGAAGVEASDRLRYGQTMAFTTLTLAQIFNVFSARSDEQSAFRGLFHNRWLWAATGLSLALHALVIYAPPLQRGFSTMNLTARDWLACAAAASSVLWLRELTKAGGRWWRRRADAGGAKSSGAGRS